MSTVTIRAIMILLSNNKYHKRRRELESFHMDFSSAREVPYSGAETVFGPLEVIGLTAETVTCAMRKQKYNCLSAERSAAA